MIIEEGERFYSNYGGECIKKQHFLYNVYPFSKQLESVMLLEDVRKYRRMKMV